MRDESWSDYRRSVSLMLGDSARRLEDIADDSVDLAATSPPYDNLRGNPAYMAIAKRRIEHADADWKKMILLEAKSNKKYGWEKLV